MAQKFDSTSASFDPEAMRARFHDLGAQRDAIAAVSEPIRAERDKHVQDARAIEDDYIAQIRAAEDGLFDIDTERAFLARGLGGKTGPAPETK